jgi:hypothetical protein
MRRRGQRDGRERGEQLPGSNANAAKSGRAPQVVWLREHDSAAGS